jgi:hypothetical protein
LAEQGTEGSFSNSHFTCREKTELSMTVLLSAAHPGSSKAKNDHKITKKVKKFYIQVLVVLFTGLELETVVLH